VPSLWELVSVCLDQRREREREKKRGDAGAAPFHCRLEVRCGLRVDTEATKDIKLVIGG
jgi:hypothetical protein